MSDRYFEVREPDASHGSKIPMPVGLGQLLQLVDPCVRWELRWIDQVWWEGNESRWVEQSWGDSPLVLDDTALRDEALHAEQVINGRFTGFDDDSREVVTIESVDSSFWLIWSDDERLLERLKDQFPGVELVTPPTPFHPLG